MTGVIASIRTAAVLVLLAVVSACSTAQTLDIAGSSRPSAPPPLPSADKYAAIVVDGSTGSVLYEHESRALRYPASLTKMMTLYMLFEAMETGRVTPSTQIPISAHAARQPPSKLGFKAGQTIDADTAIRALATKSANDVAVAVGEYLGGSEEQFAAMMTSKARAMGMRSTTFRNASGLPDSEQVTTARDMSVLGITLRRRFPAYFSYFSNQSFAFRGRSIRGHNDLIGRVDGVDGIKTGYIRASGFNIVTSVNRGGRKLVVVVMGGKTARQRNDHVEDMISRYLPLASRGGV